MGPKFPLPYRRAIRFARLLTVLGSISVAVLVSSSMTLAASPQSAELNVNVGSEFDYAPYAMINSAGQPDGYAVDLIKAVAQTTDLRLKLKLAPWSRLREMVVTGEVDVLPSMAKSIDRARSIDFSDTHIVAYDAIFIRSPSTGIHSQEDLKGKRIIVESGDLAEDYLRKSLFDGEVISVAGPAQALKLLHAGGGDAVICSQVVGLMILSEENLNDIRLADKSHFGGYKREFAFAIHKGNQELLNRLNEGLKTVIASGKYESIYKKWFSNLDPEIRRRDRNRSQFQIILLIAIVVALISVAFVLILRAEVSRKTKSLSLSEQRFRRLVEDLPGFVFRAALCDDLSSAQTEWRIVYISNPCERITGYPASDFLSGVKKFASLIHPEDRQAVQAVQQRVLAAPCRYSHDFRIINKDGQTLWLHVRGNTTAEISLEESNFHYSKSPAPVRQIETFFLDITEQKRVSDLITEQQIKLASSARLSALGEMAGGIAHEINNPLAIINLRIHQLTQLATKGDVNAEAVSRIGAQIEATAVRISKIIKALHTVARESEFDPFEKVKVNSLLSEVFELCYQRMRKNGIQVQIGNIKDDLFLECKRVQISQVLINLLNNAFDAVINERVRWIRLTAEEIDINGLTSVEFSISDSGPGIPDDCRQKIFQPFFTTKDIGKGTGLGLSISKGIIEAHSGTIWLDAKSEQTRLVFQLPQKQNQTRARRRRHSNPPDSSIPV